MFCVKTICAQTICPREWDAILRGGSAGLAGGGALGGCLLGRGLLRGRGLRGTAPDLPDFCRSTLRCRAASRSSDLGVLAWCGALLRGRNASAALELGVDQLLQLGAVLVHELVGIEVGGEDCHQRHRHLQFLVARPRRVAESESKSGFADLVRPEQRLHHQHVVADPQHGEPLLLAQREFRDRDPVGLLQR